MELLYLLCQQALADRVTALNVTTYGGSQLVKEDGTDGYHGLVPFE